MHWLLESATEIKRGALVIRLCVSRARRRIAQNERLILSDVVIVARAEALLFVRLVRFGSNERLDLFTAEKTVEVVIMSDGRPLHSDP